MRHFTFILYFVLLTAFSFGQKFPYEIKVDSIEIPQLGGLQSYSVAQANGKWLIIGGRLDGLHQRQPFAAFDIAGHNTQLIVVDPIARQKWSAPLSSLSQNLQEQLSATNIQFFQKDDILYLTGGYGYSLTDDDHKTFPFITFVDVSFVINAVINQEDITPYFHQIQDEKMAVAGGQLQLVNDVFFLVGGHRFDGRYNPMNRPTFTQTYTNAIRKFQVELNETNISVIHLQEIYDEKQLHRRDFNVLPQILPDGEEGLIAFSGVFQKNVDLPFLNALIIDALGFNVDKSFAQYYNHYHCATVALHDADQNNMHNLFFGGIAQYYDSSGILVQDNDVPFVKTIACVTRDANGWMEEFKLPISMPNYLGAASEFILNPELQLYSNEVVKLNELQNDTTLLGYIYGGIQSSAANIFWINTGIESRASQMVYPIYLIKNPHAVTNINNQSSNAFQLQVYPNPVEDELSISFTMPISGNADILVENAMGEVAYSRTFKNIPPGEYYRIVHLRKLNRGDTYFFHLTIQGKKVTQKMLVH